MCPRWPPPTLALDISRPLFEVAVGGGSPAPDPAPAPAPRSREYDRGHRGYRHVPRHPCGADTKGPMRVC
jgi:hypothetical protein